MYQQPQLVGMQTAQTSAAFLPKLPAARMPGPIEEYKYDSINSANAEELFANAYVECKIYVINHGEYKLYKYR